MKFNYLVRNNKGESHAGTIDAINKATALKTLQDRDFVVIKLQSIEKIPIFSRRIKFFEKVKRKEVFIFFRQLAILVDANVPLVQSLKSMSKQIENEYFKEIIFSIANDIDGGMSFSKSMSKYPKIFSIFSINLIKTGEVSGQLQESLIYLADHLENEYYLISKVKGAMSYPIFILGVFLLVAVLVLVMVIPQLTSILTESGQKLPWSTKLVVFTSEFITSYGWILFLFGVAAIFGFYVIKKRKRKNCLGYS